ncbi:MAG: amidase [Anaerolineales bacterium]
MNDKLYDLKSVQLPRLTGGALRLFAGLLENPLTGWLLIGKLLKDGGITRLRALKVDEHPTYLPLTDAGEAGRARAGLPLPRLADFHPRKSPVPREWHIPKTVRDYAKAYRTGQTTPEEVAARALEAIRASDASDPPMGLFIAFDPDDVMAQARAAAERIRRGEPLSIFDGVPVAIKDEVDMIPYPTTVGTRFLGRSPAREDSTVVARMRAAGALLLGKTNMYEIGINPSGLNVHHGAVRNPYNVGHNSGGSSSGSAAAVAAGFCPVAIGADGGGSIRVPAAFCGVVGLKPTFGRVSESGAYPLAWSIAHLGPLAATAEDAALAYAVIAGPDPKDPPSTHQPTPRLDGWDNPDLSGLTLGVFWPWFRHADPAVVSACESLLDAFTQLGARVQEIEIPDLDACRIAHAITILSEMAASMDRHYARHRTDFGPSVRVNLIIGRVATSRDYVQAQRVRTRVISNFRKVLEQVDVIVTPTTAITAPPMTPRALAGDESDLSVVTETMRFIVPGNFTGLPAISFPAGYDKRGLPIGMHVMGRPWEEHVLLRLAHAAEGAVKRRRPGRFMM